MLTHVCCRNCAQRQTSPLESRDESHSAGPGLDDVHISGPGVPPVADLGGYEGVRQASIPGLPDLPGRPIRRSGGGLCPPVLRRTEADGGVSSHPAPVVRCCLHPTAGCSPSVCSSPRAPSCCLQLGHSSSLHNGRRKAAQPASAPAQPVKRQGRRRP